MRVNQDQYPIYSADGRPLGFRSRKATERLLAGGYVTPCYGRKGHLKAIFLRSEDGANPVDAYPKPGTKYSFEQSLSNGHRCWTLKRLDLVDENGCSVSAAPIYRRLLLDCLTA
ncbi:MAG: hypothetical protein LC126_24260 [Bryobacterales bacterium]|nr:hypothetical protein [Bryobacterales bacterium]